VVHVVNISNIKKMLWVTSRNVPLQVQHLAVVVWEVFLRISSPIASAAYAPPDPHRG